MDLSCMYGQVFDAVLTHFAKPETAAKLARFQKQYYDALVWEGFTKDEALKIITSPLPFSPSATGK
ncbi:MAG TPA: hypothetical protein VD994_02305 [Prosthecobacter sp.]|nr:hypothetical protein [Prosthecobacter sp.]